jgi:hypothetical protein
MKPGTRLPEDPTKRTREVVTQEPIPYISNVPRGPKRRDNLATRTAKGDAADTTAWAALAKRKEKECRRIEEKVFRGMLARIEASPTTPITWEGDTPVAVVDALTFRGVREGGRLAKLGVTRPQDGRLAVIESHPLDEIWHSVGIEAQERYRQSVYKQLAVVLTAD